MATRIFQLAALAALLIVPRVAQCQQAAAEVLTLEQAIALALRDNRQIKTTMLEVNKSEDRLAAARTRRLPEFKFNALGSQLLSSLDFKFEQGVFGNYPGIGPIPTRETVISTPRRPTFIMAGQINQPLSQLYRIGLNLKQLGAGREIARQEMRARRQSVINNVKQAYYAILQTQSALRTAEETIRLYRELDRVTGDYVAQQVALKAEGLEVKTRLAKSEYEAQELGDQLASQKERLNQLLGREVNTEFEVSAAPAFSRYEADLGAARDLALAERPEIQEARLRIKQAEYDRRIKKSEYLPDVSLSFSYVSPQNVNFVPRQITTVGVTLTWEPFDWGRKKRELAEKSRSVEQARQTERETESAALIEVNSKFRKLQQTYQLLAIGRLAEETALEQARVASNRYTARAAMLKDVLQAQTALAEANHQYQQALLAFWAARADFEKAIGGDQ
ncbi:MAG TPA: TolC family protein [Blastocatellia bacterium]|jgi:outer membrane protein TolC|nr:TolC family protein [Blastocatellia bacterium]